MRKNKIIIVNSDDFGISDSVNTAIVSAFERGCISSTTLMASMPGFQDAVEKSKYNSCLEKQHRSAFESYRGRPVD